MATATKLDEFKALRRQVQDAMQQLAALAEARGLQIEDHTEDLSSRGEKSAEQPLADVLRRKVDALNAPFRLAVVGEFSRGKSTLVNALLNREVLANDHRPNTAAQTIVKYGKPERFTISFLPDLNRAPETHQTGDLLEALAAFVSDAEVDNYEALLKGDSNSLAEQIERVDVWCDSDFLKQLEIEVVDTPGLGSVFLSHKDVTLKAVRTVDAILFAIQIDPGVGRSEIAFIRFISEHVPRIFFVITKADKVQPKDEIPERVEHIRKTINIKANVDVNHIYPVSAKQASNGSYAESGFQVFVPTLEQFLVRSSGLARLVSPIRFSRVHTRQMIALVKDALKKLDVSLAEVEAELNTLREEEKRIRAQEKALRAFVDERIDSIIKNTLDGINNLPGLIQMSVEREIDSLKSDELKRADFFIQPAIKEAVVKWIEQRKTAFSSEIKTLNKHVKREMTEIMKAFHFDEEQLSLIRSIDMEVNLPLDTSRYTRDIGDEIVKLLVSTGISSSIASIAGSVARAAAGVFNMVKSGLARLFGGRPQPPKDNTTELKMRLKTALRETLSNNSVNTYQGIVFGHRQNKRRVPGVKDAIEGTFGDWGSNLKNDISAIISNNLKTRLKELERQAKEKRAGKKDYEADRRRLEKEKAELDQLLKAFDAFDDRLAKFEDIS